MVPALFVSVTLLGLLTSLGGSRGISDFDKIATFDQAFNAAGVSERGGDTESSTASYLSTLASRSACLPVVFTKSISSARPISAVRLARLPLLRVFSVIAYARNRPVELRDRRAELCRCHAGARIPRLGSEDPFALML